MQTQRHFTTNKKTVLCRALIFYKYHLHFKKRNRISIPYKIGYGPGGSFSFLYKYCRITRRIYGDILIVMSVIVSLRAMSRKSSVFLLLKQMFTVYMVLYACPLPDMNHFRYPSACKSFQYLCEFSSGYSDFRNWENSHKQTNI